MLATEAPSKMAELANRFQSISYVGAFTECKRLILQNIRDNFTSSASPRGQSWPQRKKIGDGHPLLMDKGKLLQAATGGGAGHIDLATDSELVLGISHSVVPYVNVHNFGYPERNLPQREFFGISDETSDEIENVIGDHVQMEVMVY